MTTKDSPVGDEVPASVVIRPKLDGDSVGMTLFIGGGGIAMICVALLVSKGSGHSSDTPFRVGLGLVGLALVCLPVLMIWQYRLLVTADSLVLRRLGKKPKAVANRADIAKARWQRRGRGHVGVFVDANGVVLLELGPFFLKKQVKQIAAMLDVPVKG
jgi:hypothetical protein